ncbi:MAG: Bax inhibitor-1 family protein [Phycisphaerales bacterium]|nr:Bax inhibitor-1 family protein [Phycisphaerales bacterium]
MSQMTYAHPGLMAAEAGTSERMAFIRRTYLHLFGAIFIFTAIEAMIFASGAAASIAQAMMGSWILVLVAFIGVSFLANWWATRETSLALQYAGLGLFIGVEALIFLPLLYLAVAQGGGIDVIVSAGSVTAILCGFVTIFVFVTKKDFSFMGWAIRLCMIGALILVVLATLFGWPLGAWFSGLMVVLGLGYLLYETSNVLHRYRTDQHVAASLALFASVMLVFYYVLRLFMSRD